MKKLLCLLLIVQSIVLTAQNDITREGLFFGFSAGGGIHLSNDDYQSRMSLPNIKIGYMVNEKLGFGLYMPGGVSTINSQNRAFEAFLPSVQYYLTKNWYASAGVGLSLETTPFYDVDFSVGPPDFYVGPGFGFAAGYEFLHFKDKFAVDIQSRVLLGQIYSDKNNSTEQAAFDILIGFTIF